MSEYHIFIESETKSEVMTWKKTLSDEYGPTLSYTDNLCQKKRYRKLWIWDKNAVH